MKCTLQLWIKPEPNINFQSFAREARYSFFQSLGYDKILTAHHSDDNLETVLLHIFTGRSINQIPEINKNVIRPLLDFSKQEIIEYAEQNKIEYVQDESNFGTSYDRNFIRNKIIPLLDENFAQAKKRILNLSSNISENEDLLTQCSSELLEIEKQNERFIINKAKLSEGKSLLLFHGIKQWGFNVSQCEDIIDHIEENWESIFFG